MPLELEVVPEIMCRGTIAILVLVVGGTTGIAIILVVLVVGQTLADGDTVFGFVCTSDDCTVTWAWA